MLGRQRLEEFSKTEYDNCLKMACRYVTSRQEAEDCVQDAFVKATLSIDQYDESRPFTHWFIKILANTCFDHLRSAVRKHEVPFSTIQKYWPGIEELFGVGADLNVIVLEKYERERKVKAIRKAMAMLDDDQLDLLMLAHVRETPTETISEWLGVSVNAVYLRLSRIRKAIKMEADKILAEEE